MKILFITTGLKTGGAEIALLKIISGLKHDHDIQVVSLTTSGNIGPEIEKLGIIVTCLHLGKNPLTILKLIKLFRLIKTFNADIVQTWMYHADLLGGIIAKLAGVKTIIWGIRNSDLNLDRVAYHTFITAKICALLSSRIPNKILTNSLEAQNSHIKLGYNPIKLIVLPNGFDLHKFKKDSSIRKSTRERLGMNLNEQIVGMIGRFDPQKNHSGFMECAKLILKTKKDVRFLLVGPGITKNNQTLYDLIPEEYLENFILAGAQTDMIGIYNALDILTLSSYGESFPNVLGEAMACEVPCVSTLAGDSRHIIGETGITVPIGEMKQLSEGILKVLELSETERLQLGQDARTRILQNFDIQSTNNRLSNLYTNIVKTG